MRSLSSYINEEEVNESLVESKSEELFEVMKSNKIDEGFLGSVLGGLTGLVAGSSIMKAVCKTLGIQSGILYNLLTSKIVCTAAGAAIGKNM